MVTQVVASTPVEIAEVLRSASTVRVVGGDSTRVWRRPVSADIDLKIGSRGILEHDVDDQVVVVSAGATIAEVQAGLKKKGQCVPVGTSPFHMSTAPGTVGGRLSINLPHGSQYFCGSWRDWVLGLTIVRPDGTIAKCGSKAVKNVAGYDVAKLFIGARGTLGVVAEVILRTYPLRALPPPDFEMNGDHLRGAKGYDERGYIQRVSPADFERARTAHGPRLGSSMPRIGVLYIFGEEPPLRFADDWVLGWGQGEQNIVIDDSTLRRLMDRTKAALDPQGKMNPGEFY